MINTFLAQIKSLLLVLASAYLILLGIVYFFQSKLVYFPFKIMSKNPNTIGLEYENITFYSNDKTKLFGWYIPKEYATKTVLFLHGNAGNISHRLDSIKIFNSLGLNVFIFDYRGYGNSKGVANEQNTYDDAKSAWEYLINTKGINPKEIIIFGRSLGGSIAANLASKVKPKAVILESTLTSAKELVSDVYPFVPQGLIHFKYKTKNYIKEIHSPILVIHSQDDKIIPFKHGKMIFEYANEPKSFIKLRGSHNNCFLESSESYIKGLKEFL